MKKHSNQTIQQPECAELTINTLFHRPLEQADIRHGSRKLDVENGAAVKFQLRNRLSNVIQCQMAALFRESIQYFWLPATSQFFNRAYVDIAVMEIFFQTRHMFVQET